MAFHLFLRRSNIGFQETQNHSGIDLRQLLAENCPFTRSTSPVFYDSGEPALNNLAVQVAKFWIARFVSVSALVALPPTSFGRRYRRKLSAPVGQIPRSRLIFVLVYA